MENKIKVNQIPYVRADVNKVKDALDKFIAHVHRVSDAIQPSHPLTSPSPPAPNPCQHQTLFQ